MTAEYSHESLEVLTKAENYRSFVRLAIEARFGEPGEKGAYTRMSRIAGFSSRSTVREVVIGRKRLAAGSLEKFVLGLGLKGDLREYFVLLVARDEERLNPRGMSNKRIDARLETLRERMLRRTTNLNRELAGSILASRDRFAVFAALGTAERGATLEEVRTRSAIPCARIEVALSQLEKANLARRDGSRILPATTHFDFDALGHDVTFEKFYRAGVQETLHRLKKRPECLRDRNRLYFESIYSIDQSRIGEFRTKLRALCMQFVDKSEAPEGDMLAKFLVAFEPYES